MDLENTRLDQGTIYTLNLSTPTYSISPPIRNMTIIEGAGVCVGGVMKPVGAIRYEGWLVAETSESVPEPLWNA